MSAADEAQPGPALGPNEIHVWRAQLDAFLARLPELAASLAPDEIERAERFAFPQLRQRFIIGRGLLRAILARYLQLPPSELRFGYTTYGKPFLIPEQAGPAGLSFNLAHSDSMALYAVTYDRAVGVDIERQDRAIDVEGIAKRYFSPAECAAVMAAPPHLRYEAFYRCWTRKEAFIKAHGAGLSLPLHSFQVSVGADEPPRVLSVDGSPEAAQRWSLWDIADSPAYAAALVAEAQGTPLSVSLRTLPAP